MSALCQKRTLRAAARISLFDHLVGARQQGRRHSQAKCLGSFQVDGQVELDRGLDWEVARTRTLQNTINIDSRPPPIINEVGTVRQQAAKFSEKAYA